MCLLLFSSHHADAAQSVGLRVDRAEGTGCRGGKEQGRRWNRSGCGKCGRERSSEIGEEVSESSEVLTFPLVRLSESPHSPARHGASGGGKERATHRRHCTQALR